jgi:hypothetical protein
VRRIVLTAWIPTAIAFGATVDGHVVMRSRWQVRNPLRASGEYYAFAIATDDYFDPNNNLNNELLKQSTPVTVVDNEAITAEIRLIER